MLEERLSIYGIGLSFPRNWLLRFGGQLSFSSGELEVEEPGRTAVFTLIWSPLERLQASRGSPPNPSQTILDEYRRMVLSKLSKETKNLRVISSSRVEVGGHEALLEELVFLAVAPGFLLRRVKGVVCRIHLLTVCDRSKRVLAAHGSALERDFEAFRSVFSEMALSLTCHVS